MQQLTDLQNNYWASLASKNESVGKVNNRTSQFLEAYVAQLAKMYKAAKKGDKKAIILLRNNMRKWCRANVSFLLNLEKQLDYLDLTFEGAGAREASYTNDAVLIEMSKLNKKEAAFEKTFITSLTRSFKQVEFTDQNLKQYCVDLLNSFRQSIRRLKSVSEAVNDVINKIYSVNRLAGKNIRNKQLAFTSNSQYNHFQKLLKDLERSNRILDKAINVYYGR